MGLRQKGRQEILPTTLLASDLHDGRHGDDDVNDEDDDDDDKSYDDDDVNDNNDDNGSDKYYDSPCPLIRSVLYIAIKI